MEEIQQILHQSRYKGLFAAMDANAPSHADFQSGQGIGDLKRREMGVSTCDGSGRCCPW